ncbi:hypothetical protein IQ06DRAFT_379221 [Phaeosphaeriaceae sp. SRC1lsM3a]|nr:hypothetical protein IQ06DRAFT_379221 [Stagonospora sp. SRC1lsM3a]
MSDPLCGVCNAEPKKYKCPTCSLPYCSITCFKLHKSTHPESSTTPSTAQKTPSDQTILPQPAQPPAPLPRYLKNKTDFSLVATHPQFTALLKTHPALLPTLQRVYAATIEPDPEDRRSMRGGFRGRGTRGRGRGRGRGGFEEREGRWTQKKGDTDGLGLLKGVREGKMGEKEKEGMRAFVELLEEVLGKKEGEEDGGSG